MRVRNGSKQGVGNAYVQLCSGYMRDLLGRSACFSSSNSYVKTASASLLPTQVSILVPISSDFVLSNSSSFFLILSFLIFLYPFFFFSTYSLFSLHSSVPSILLIFRRSSFRHPLLHELLVYILITTSFVACIVTTDVI
ncbi:hypothetical protein K431DRAFT_122686 [Polychaeton citri CBS 116435]|uniref:Uncharacterized protein n=1 Tax=Polychaeton citri CBS 116435 TaxID=1314669 RepID=A0A9P4UM14_9PEZI|nr:hypothetical protein K431DRAFT_122686 [Polychaeton citri CBS 116435]